MVEMIEIILLLLFFLVGYLTTLYIFKKPTFEELLGYSLIFALTIVPWFLINLSLVFKVNPSFLLMFIIGVLILGILLFKVKLYFAKPTFILVIIVLLSVFFFFYHNDSELYLSLASYLDSGQTNCFYMLNFALQPELSNYCATPDIYNILSTPGNTLFTFAWFPILKFLAFKFIYILTNTLIFIFTYLVLKRFTNESVAIITALFAVLNPFILSIEVLDRNVLAFMMSIVLIYTLLNNKDNVLLHGFLFGITAGLGLRFLPLVFILPLFIQYFSSKAPFSNYIKFIAIAVIVFAFNIPHIKYHGFNSQGETSNYFELGTKATQMLRTPFVPYPNFIYFPLMIISYLGIATMALIGLGAIENYRKEWKLFLMMILMISLPYFTLAIQRDIIESPKLRIAMTGFLPLVFWFGYGLESLLKEVKKITLKHMIMMIFLLFCIYIALSAIAMIDFVQDDSFYSRKLSYQKETTQYYQFLRDNIKYTFLPDYYMLGNKLNLLRKPEEIKAVITNLNNRPSFKSFLGKEPYKSEILHKEYVEISIDLNQLVIGMPKSAYYSNSGNYLIDFSKEDLLSAYYFDTYVSWQKEKLPGIIFTDLAESRYLDEIYIDLNSFISYGPDGDGFQKVNSVNFMHYPQALQYAFDTGIPIYEISNGQIIVLNVPKDSRLIVRNWFVNGANAQIFKLDSWVINLYEEPVVSFQYNEPESYI